MGNDVKVSGATGFNWATLAKDAGKGTEIGAGVGGVLGIVGGPLGVVLGAVGGAISGAEIGGIVGLFQGQGHGVQVDAGPSAVPGGAAIDTGDLKEELGDHPGGQNALCDQVKAKVEDLNKKFDDSKNAYKDALTKDPKMGPDERLAYETNIKQSQANFDQYKVNAQSVLGQLGALQPLQDALGNVQQAQRDVPPGSPQNVVDGAAKDVRDAQARLDTATNNIQATLNTPGPIVDQAARFQAALNDSTLETGAQASSVLSTLNPQIPPANANEVDQSKAQSLTADLGNNPALLTRLQTALGIANPSGVMDEETQAAIAQLTGGSTEGANGAAGAPNTDAIQNMVLQMLVNDRQSQTNSTSSLRMMSNLQS